MSEPIHMGWDPALGAARSAAMSTLASSRSPRAIPSACGRKSPLPAVLAGALLLANAGAAMADTVPAAPRGLCLEPNGGCVTVAEPPAPPAPPADGDVNWHPGHYFRNFHDEYKTAEAINEDFLGVQFSVPWQRLEANNGQFDFSIIDRGLNELRPKGKRLFLNIGYKGYNGAAREAACAPRDLITSGDAVRFTGGIDYCLALIWKAEVADRFIRLIQQLGRRYANEPLLEGISFEESALSLTPELKKRYGYSDGAFIAQTKRIWAATRAALPNKVMLPQLNFIPGDRGQMVELFNYLKSIGGGVNGPDMAPDWHSEASPLYAQYAGQIPLAIENQYTILKKYLDDGATPQAVYNWAVTQSNGLKANYVFWNRGTDSWPGRGWDFKGDLIPMLQRNNWRINASCPSNIDCGN